MFINRQKKITVFSLLLALLLFLLILPVFGPGEQYFDNSGKGNCTTIKADSLNNNLSILLRDNRRPFVKLLQYKNQFNFVLLSFVAVILLYCLKKRGKLFDSRKKILSIIPLHFNGGKYKSMRFLG